MEEFFQALGIVSVILLIAVGLLAGWIASVVAGGRHRGRYLVIGVLGALVAPVIAAALGATILAASGILAILAVAAVGAIIVLVIAKAIFD